MNAGGVVALIPTVGFLAQAAESGNPISLAWQLGIGAVLVAFAVWLQERMSRERKADLKAQEERCEAEKTLLRTEKDQLHDELANTRAQLIAALTRSNPPKENC